MQVIIEKYSVLQPEPKSLQNQEILKRVRKKIYQNHKGTSALFKHMNKIKSANRNTANYHLYHALMEALIADEDAMDKEVADKVKDHKRKHDSDDDEGPSAGSNQGKSAKRRRHDSGASGSAQPPTKDDEPTSSKKPAGRIRTYLSQSQNNIHADEGNESDMEDTDNAHIPKVLTTTWFKPIPESKRLDTLNQLGPFPRMISQNQRITGQIHTPQRKVPEENKLQRKTYDIGSFIKWFCRRIGKKKLCKADLEGPAFNLVKAFQKTTLLQYQWMNAISCWHK
ncbi:hypothetical protein Tco_1576047 [Tanacetum coccineum]